MLSSVTLNTHSFPHKDCQNPQFSPFGPSKCREKTLINTKFLNSKVCFGGPRSYWNTPKITWFIKKPSSFWHFRRCMVNNWVFREVWFVWNICNCKYLLLLQRISAGLKWQKVTVVAFLMLLPLNSCLELPEQDNWQFDIGPMEFSMDFSCSIATSSHCSDQHSHCCRDLSGETMQCRRGYKIAWISPICQMRSPGTGKIGTTLWDQCRE